MSGRAARALVTGASRGVGAAIATMLARRGFDLLLHGRDRERLEDLRASLSSAGGDGDDASDERRGRDPSPGSDTGPETNTSRGSGTSRRRDTGRGRDTSAGGAGRRHSILTAELSSSEQVIDLARRVGEAPLDLLVLNAGVATNSSIAETSFDTWRKTFAVNVDAPFLLLRELTPALVEAHGRVVVIGSVVSTQGYVNQGAYAASKHALYGLAKVYARELHERGVRLQMVRPGGIDTDMVREMRPDLDTSGLIRPDEVADAIGALLDLGAHAMIDDIAIRRGGKAPFSG